MAIENGILKPSGVIQLRGGTAATLASVNPVLNEREIVIETDTGKIKTGTDGLTAWNDLPYVGGNGFETWTFELEDGSTLTREVSSWISEA